MAAINKKKITYFGIGLLAIFVGYNFFVRRNTCGYGPEPFTISTIGYGPFVESIPQTGTVEHDTVTGALQVKVPIDELYQSRISTGLKATTDRDNKTYSLEITNVYPTVVEGRFNVHMKFKGETPPHILNGQSTRMRIELSEPSSEILLPVGGFYIHTRGKWIFVVEENGMRAVKREIQLGRKNTEHFVVLQGLKPGDRVVTSSYKEFKNLESLDITELKKKPI